MEKKINCRKFNACYATDVVLFGKLIKRINDQLYLGLDEIYHHCNEETPIKDWWSLNQILLRLYDILKKKLLSRGIKFV